MASRELSPKAVRVITGLLFVATFVAGTLTGAGLCRWTCVGAPPMPPGPLPLWELELTPSQQNQAHQIMEKHRPELDLILREAFPKVREVNDKIESEVRGILTDQQKTKLDMLKARRPPPGHHGPPPPLSPPPPPPSASASN